MCGKTIFQLEMCGTEHFSTIFGKKTQIGIFKFNLGGRGVNLAGSCTQKKGIYIYIYLYISHLLPLYRRTFFKLKNPMLYIGRKCTCIPDLREKAIYWHIALIWGLYASYRTCMRAISSENMRAGWVICGAMTKTS